MSWRTSRSFPVVDKLSPHESMRSYSLKASPYVGDYRGVGVMSTAAECRKYAENCVELAQTAKSEHHRTMLLEMAEKWLRFADDAQHRSQLHGNAA